MARCNILVVDDEPTTSELLKTLLDAHDFEVTTTDSALGVPALVRRLRPDAMLLDLGLPYRSGASLLGELKADPSTAGIPVIVVSGMTESLAGERRALAFEVIAKPFDNDLLLDAVRRACATAGTARSDDESRGHGSAHPPNAAR